MVFKKIGAVLVILMIFTGFSVYTSKKISEEISPSKPVLFEIQGNSAVMVGIINENIVYEVENLVNNHPDVKTIVMLNVPGSVNSYANLKAARIVRANNISTIVPKNGYIASGGTVFFCAGVNRTIEEGAKVGVHSWKSESVTDASKLPKNSPLHKPYIDYFNEMGISDEFYWFMISSAPSFGIYYLNDYELKKYGLVTG
ncbi:COG3904 family protein [Methanococcus sp. CF]